ncbi:DUF4142 domain-containing protein [Rufibacter roseus]|uniref:DUF4142 domain-containing protein n=1 Tax=Rufibacter roseus TaxID=1567108 RepID=A0ABW2DKR4_9BACT|nr:DUF4142 domain-containing protein [Rufibacter roseus]
MKYILIIGLALGISSMSCQRASTFTPSVDTAANASVTPEREQQLPTSTGVVNGRALTDPVFIMEAASNSLLQISLGRTALEKATNAEVKKFAQMMIDHHSKEDSELKAIASEIGTNLTLTLLPQHQRVVDKLSELHGKKFEEEYMEEMEAIHEQQVATYEVMSNSAQTVRVKAYAIRMLPLLRTHLFEADRVEDIVD